MSQPPDGPPCAVCGKPRQPRYRPFCSPRCQQIDLSRWLKGAYTIAGAESEADSFQPPENEE